MTTSDKLREIAAKWKLTQADLEIWKAERRIVQTPIPGFLSDLTALISEDYVERAEYDELLRQRDELREALIIAVNVMKQYYDLYNAFDERNAIKLAEAAIKNTENDNEKDI